MHPYRQPLSGYVPAPMAQVIAAVRAVIDLIQHRLIPAHGMLCRDDERGDWPPLAARLRNNRWPPLTLCFAEPAQRGPWHCSAHRAQPSQGQGEQALLCPSAQCPTLHPIRYFSAQFGTVCLTTNTT
jgi:hypothetical protein